MDETREASTRGRSRRAGSDILYTVKGCRRSGEIGWNTHLARVVLEETSNHVNGTTWLIYTISPRGVAIEASLGRLFTQNDLWPHWGWQVWT